MNDINPIEKEIQTEAKAVLTKVKRFVLYYIVLIISGFLLIGAALVITYLSVAGMLEGSFSLGGLVLLFAMWVMCFQFSWHLIKPLFTVRKYNVKDKTEITREDCPELFDIISDVATKTGNQMPLHVYLTTKANAGAFYDSNSFWSFFFPSEKNLQIGLGLVALMNTEELKSVIAHEYGHFSQGTMKVGLQTYRLLLVIQDMVQNAQEKSEDAFYSRDLWWHLANLPINLVTRMTIAFYNKIEYENRKLSRLMEFQADLVACSITGRRAFASALSKLDIISERAEGHEGMMWRLLQREQYTDDYYGSFDAVSAMYAHDDQKHVDYSVILSTPLTELIPVHSLLEVVEGWNTHPSIPDRIDNIENAGTDNQFSVVDARTLVPAAVANKAMDQHLQYILEKSDDCPPFQLMSLVEEEELQTSLSEIYEQSVLPYFVRPFIHKPVVSFDYLKYQNAPSEENPFTTENHRMLKQFECDKTDLATVENRIKDKTAGELYFKGKPATDLNLLKDDYEERINNRIPELQQLDIDIYRFLLYKEDPDKINSLYLSLFHSINNYYPLKETKDMADEIRRQAEGFRRHGESFELKEDVKVSLYNRQKEILRGLDYDHLFNYFKDVPYDENSPVAEKLKLCRYLAFSDELYIDVSFLYNIIDQSFAIIYKMYLDSKAGWDELVYKYCNPE